MMNRDMIMFKLGSMSDQELLKGFAATGAMDGQMGGGGALDCLTLGGEDPDNMVKSWGELKIEKGNDDRPKLADKDFLLKKDTLQTLGRGMPMDSGEGAYDAGIPGSF